MKLLLTGGTTFVSRYAARYFVQKGHDVYVLNRGNKQQEEGVHLIQCDRYNLKDKLKGVSFDAILDICAYNDLDSKMLIEAVDDIKDFIFISSSAVYPETLSQPFVESQEVGYNKVWKEYGMNKIKAENYVREHVPQAYILRPPYLYGPMQNVYREPFIFECALANRPFYIPKDGSMPLQFFHVDDLCRFMEIILHEHPEEHIFNVGNYETVTISEFVALCYESVNVKLHSIFVKNDSNQREYFSFYDYAYVLDVEKQKQWMPQCIPLREGLKESFRWYLEHPKDVVRKDYIAFIDKHLKK